MTRVIRHARLVSTGMLMLAVLLLAFLVANHLTDGFDGAVTDWLTDPGRRGVVVVLRPITELGSTWAVTVVAVTVLLVMAIRGAPRLGVLAAGTIGLTSLLSTGVKSLLARARPEIVDAPILEPGYSFPSGHALLSATAYGVVAVLVWRSGLAPSARTVVVGALAAVVLLVGVSRVYLGVHYLTDVTAGWLAGLAIVLLFAHLTQRRLAADESAPADQAASVE